MITLAVVKQEEQVTQPLLFINGQKVDTRQLQHNDRVVVGKSATFIFQGEGEEVDKSKDWEFC